MCWDPSTCKGGLEPNLIALDNKIGRRRDGAIGGNFETSSQCYKQRRKRRAQGRGWVMVRPTQFDRPSE